MSPINKRSRYIKASFSCLQLNSFVLLFLPIIVSVACPTGPHPPPRLARRPNRGHIGGALLRYMPMMFLSRVGSVLPPSSTVKSMNAPRHYLLTKSGVIASNFSMNRCTALNSSGCTLSGQYSCDTIIRRIVAPFFAARSAALASASRSCLACAFAIALGYARVRNSFGHQDWASTSLPAVVIVLVQLFLPSHPLASHVLRALSGGCIQNV